MSKILIVDDDEQLGRSIARVVQREGHETLLVESPTRALDMNADFRADLVIVELSDPWVKRIPQLRDHAEHVAGRRVPFVFTVGRRELYRSMGPAFAPHDDWVTKPFDPEELAIRVATAVRRSAPSELG